MSSGVIFFALYFWCQLCEHKEPNTCSITLLWIVSMWPTLPMFSENLIHLNISETHYLQIVLIFKMNINVLLANELSLLMWTEVLNIDGGGGGLVAKSCPTLATPWIVTHQAPLPMKFSRQEYWSELPFSSPGDLPDPGNEPRSPALQADSLPTE